MLIQILVCLVVGYGFGCFSTGYFVGKLNHIDIREKGSGNSGTTNALRTMGIKAGILTFLGDLLKAMIPVIAVRILFRDLADSSVILSLYAGLGVVMGHNFPFWLHFKGGKGIAVTAAVILSIADYRITLGGLLLFILIVAVTRYVSLGSLMVAFLLPLNTILFYRDSNVFLHMLLVSLCFTVLAYIRHWSNIKNLLHGTERKIGDKKGGQK